jgi:hypothetical protein
LAEIDDLRGSWYPCWRGEFDVGVWFLESVLHQQMEIVALVEHLALDMGVMFSQEADFSVLLGHEFLAHCRDLDIYVILGKIEIGSEKTGWVSFVVPFKGEGIRFVLPVDPVEVEDASKLALAVVSELGELSR